MANVYLQVDFKTGNIFQYSKTIQEGYDSHINTKGTESWRKIYKRGLYAKLESVSIRDSDFGKEISVATKLGNGDNAFLNFPLFDERKNIASYAESFISVLPALKVGESYRFFPYNIKEDNDKYAKIGFSVKLADLANETVLEGVDKLPKLSYSYIKDGVPVVGDIPAIVWEEDYTGAKTMNKTAKNKFLYDVLIKNSSASNQSPQTPAAPAPQAQTPVPAAPAKPAAPQAPAIDEHDDLPF